MVFMAQQLITHSTSNLHQLEETLPSKKVQNYTSKINMFVCILHCFHPVNDRRNGIYPTSYTSLPPKKLLYSVPHALVTNCNCVKRFCTTLQ